VSPRSAPPARISHSWPGSTISVARPSSSIGAWDAQQAGRYVQHRPQASRDRLAGTRHVETDARGELRRNRIDRDGLIAVAPDRDDKLSPVSGGVQPAIRGEQCGTAPARDEPARLNRVRQHRANAVDRPQDNPNVPLLRIPHDAGRGLQRHPHRLVEVRRPRSDDGEMPERADSQFQFAAFRPRQAMKRRLCRQAHRAGQIGHFPGNQLRAAARVREHVRERVRRYNPVVQARRFRASRQPQRSCIAHVHLGPDERSAVRTEHRDGDERVGRVGAGADAGGKGGHGYEQETENGGGKQAA
jgi:hypothetical protein